LSGDQRYRQSDFGRFLGGLFIAMVGYLAIPLVC
jgi:hypothetical protein